MTRVDLKPADLGQSGWTAILPPRNACAPLQEDIRCDFLVVGAGFAGLSAARRLRQLNPDADIVILEALEIAQGPVGRNSGFMIDLPHALANGSYAGDNSRDLRNIRMNRAAIDFAEAAARQYRFSEECFVRSGKVNAAASDSGMRHNREYAQHLDHLHEEYELLDAVAMRDLCGSDYYRGGLRTPGTAVIQPSLYSRTFADALVSQDNCRLFENSAVHSFSKQGDRWQVETATGLVEANRMILAVNGLIETFGFFKHQLMHINLYGSMTRALTSSEIETLGGEPRWGFTPSDPIGSTVRRIDGTGGHRLIIRNRCTYEASLDLPQNRLDKIKPDHERTYTARFPMLKDVPLEYCWSGRLCLSRNDAWALGELKPGLYSACCQNGLGATRGTIAGIVAAEMASEYQGQGLIADFENDVEPKNLFPEPFMTVGARTVIRLKEFAAGKEL
ncbi:MAG: FAD-binding oxidoreductase [Pseudomonadota bacterium]